jgi:hypothetical protein
MNSMNATLVNAGISAKRRPLLRSGTGFPASTPDALATA